jgi:hypothetical protein
MSAQLHVSCWISVGFSQQDAYQFDRKDAPAEKNAELIVWRQRVIYDA